MKLAYSIATLVILLSSVPLTWSLQTPATHKALSNKPMTAVEDRRQMLNNLFAGSLVLAGVTQPAMALDMDAFVNSELAEDTKNCDAKRDPKCIPKLTEDQALCKYGQSGQARADACKRVKSQGGQVDKPTPGKTLGGAYAM